MVIIIEQQLDAHMGLGIVPDLNYAALDLVIAAPGHQDKVPNPEVPTVASHHGLPPNVL